MTVMNREGNSRHSRVSLCGGVSFLVGQPSKVPRTEAWKKAFVSII